MRRRSISSRGATTPLRRGIRRSGQDWRLRVDERSRRPGGRGGCSKLAGHLRGRTISRKELGDFPVGVGHWVNLVRVPPCGTWEQRGAHTYGLASEWVGPLEASEGDGIEHLARSYLGAFGPAAPKDIASWSKSRPEATVARARANAAPPLPRRGGQGAPRPPPRPASRPGDAGTRAVPADLGRDAARPRAPHADPPRGVPAADLPHEGAALVPDVPRRRPGRGHLALRGRASAHRALRRGSRAARAPSSRTRRRASPSSTGSVVAHRAGDLPTFRSPTWPRSTCANAWLTNGYSPARRS